MKKITDEQIEQWLDDKPSIRAKMFQYLRDFRDEVVNAEQPAPKFKVGDKVWWVYDGRHEAVINDYDDKIANCYELDLCDGGYVWTYEYMIESCSSEPFSIGQTFTMQIGDIPDCEMKVVAYDKDKPMHMFEWSYWKGLWTHTYPNYSYFEPCYKAIPIDARYWTGEIAGVKVRAYEDNKGSLIMKFCGGCSLTYIKNPVFANFKVERMVMQDAIAKYNIRVMPWEVHELLGLDGFPKTESEE